MTGFFELLTRSIIYDIFIGYGLYSIVWGVVTLIFKKNEWIDRLDFAANGLVRFSGLLYSICFLNWICIIRPDILQNIDWRGPIIQAGIWILTTQMLWNIKLQQLILVRIIIALFLIFSVEKFIIVLTLFDRDFIPSKWDVKFNLLDWILNLIFKIANFCLLSLLYLFPGKKFKKLK